MARAKGKDPGGKRLIQLKKLSFPCLLSDYVLQAMFLLLEGVVWKEMSAGGWNSTKPRLKGVSRSQLGPEARAGAHALAPLIASGEGAPDQHWGCARPTANGRSHVNSIDSTLDGTLGKAAGCLMLHPRLPLCIPPTPLARCPRPAA